jgi:transglutaminase-like putative cysteine protease
MIRSHLLCRAVILLIACSGASYAQKPAARREAAISFNVGPIPNWVRNIESPPEDAVHQESAGSYYLLLDRQVNVERSASYWHEVRKITSENGVQAGASLSISFDPSTEKLTLHSIRLVRNGVSSDRLDRSHLTFAPSEQDPQRLAYSRYYKAQTSLDDVRVADIIELAYTTEGVNSPRDRKYSDVFAMQWTVPVGLNFVRFIYPSGRDLGFRLRNDTTQPVLASDKGVTEWLYEAANVPGRTVEDDVPEDYNPRRQLHVSEFGSWAEVAQWALPLFQPTVSNSNDFDDQVGRLKSIADPEQRVVAALRFLQDEIRYLSVDWDSGLRRPTPLNEIVRRRYADSKDEALLLAELLRRTGIDAAVALVSDSYRDTLREFMPSPNAFDHAILQVQLGPKTHWIDPMRSAQRGPLSEIYVANYGLALAVRPGTTELTSFRAPEGSWQSKKVIDNFRIWKPGADAELDVISEYRASPRTAFEVPFRRAPRKTYRSGISNFTRATTRRSRSRKALV